jgi:ribosome-binding factor A
MPREFSRLDRIADLIQKELAQIIQRELNDPRVGMLTISQVKVLAHAKVSVTVFQEAQVTETIATLNRAAGFLRGALAKRVKIRVMPALVFIYDDSFIKADRLTKLIDQAVKSDQNHNENNE